MKDTIKEFKEEASKNREQKVKTEAGGLVDYALGVCCPKPESP